MLLIAITNSQNLYELAQQKAGYIESKGYWPAPALASGDDDDDDDDTVFLFSKLLKKFARTPVSPAVAAFILLLSTWKPERISCN